MSSEELLLCLVGLGVLVSLFDWRRGVFLWIVIAAVQGPLRKMAPGAPAYLVLATVPVLGAVLTCALFQQRDLWWRFRAPQPRLAKVILVFFVSLIPAAIQSATYGPGSWQLTILGLLSFLSVIGGLVLGFAYRRRNEDLSNILSFYCVVTAIVLLGTLLEYLDLYPAWDALGSRALNMDWTRTRTGYTVRLVGGFYRSPDIMGWHAAIVAMVAFALAQRYRGARRWFWVTVSGWSTTCAFLCGRRKMFMMLPLFLALVLWLYWRRRSSTWIVGTIGVIVVAGVVGFGLYENVGRSSFVERYYSEGTGDLLDRLYTNYLGDMQATLRQSGFWGEGLGTATQGTQHLNVARPRTWQESGLSRMLVELGVPGLVCFLALGIVLFLIVLRSVQRVPPHLTDLPLYVALGALFIANAANFLVSHQIFGDPFIATFFGFTIGLLLSAAVLRDATVPRSAELATPKRTVGRD